MRLLVPLLAALALLAAGPAAAGAANPWMAKVGTKPLSSAAAAKKVKRHGWEPRPQNAKANRRVPTASQLRIFRRRSDMPYKADVDGRFRGNTDDILEWTAIKWGIDHDLVRAVAAVESWWDVRTLGDGGDSFGLFQMRRPYHCCLPFMQQASAFNADYWGAIIRSYYDGKHPWLNTVERAEEYRAGDLWGSIGVWASGRWHLGKSDSYVAQVKDYLKRRVWEQPNFVGR
ncbi:hypothetical protein [Conexibacter sp. SYSU D00693]|uniref:hypothetical protein n=1 Tax=Conexibacter sp. SYSU D00693 TaxID=2812560 RepID=UPI00196AF6E3|nr:hypothetical protein [Conexibacter sp. SYSU D00693]